MATKYAGVMEAPEFPAGLQWLNARKPLTLAELRGRLVLLDFWTYCCINCMHIIPQLRLLERRFPDELVVIGVHSAKFDQERSTENIRQAIMRYGVSHPVVNDAEMAVWRSFGVRSWPTLMFINPQGMVIGRTEGEITYEQGVEIIGDMLREFRQAGVLTPSPLELVVEEPGASVLSFPGRVLADGASERLFVADSGHHRIIIAGLDGRVRQVVGSGDEGLADGSLEGARFCRPQGMALDGDVLYVADTENHAVRRVDLAEGVVETIAGTGRQGGGAPTAGDALSVDLRSPWDLTLVGANLHIAMAGSHQLWAMDLSSGQIKPTVGSGAEDIADGYISAAAARRIYGTEGED